MYEETSHLYSWRYGRPPIDPVVIVKYLLVGFLYGIPSERQIEERCADSNALRWYLGIDLDERMPDRSAISQLRRRKKRTRQIKKDNRRTKKRVSRTDPEAGHMKRPGKPRGQYCLSHQTLDSDHGIIIGLTVTPGDAHDMVPYLEQVEVVHQRVIPPRAAAADSAYDFPLAHRELEKLGIEFFVRPQPAHDGVDSIRGEYVDMLKRQIARSDNGIVRSKYIAFGVPADGLETARALPAGTAAYVDRMREYAEAEDNECCREMIEDNITQIGEGVTSDAIRHRFFLIFQYEANVKSKGHSV